MKRILTAMECATEDEALSLLNKFNSFLREIRIATGTMDMQSALAAVRAKFGAPQMSNSNTGGNATEAERAVMKATGKSLAFIREAKREWNERETLCPNGQMGVFFAPRDEQSSPSPRVSLTESRPRLTITDAHRAVARATGRTPEQIAEASAAETAREAHY